jgi:PAS domain S-box-containing protein
MSEHAEDEKQRFPILVDPQVELAAIIESSDDAIIGKNLNGIIQSWNAGAQRLFGWTPEEAIGKPITIIIPLDRLEEEHQILARLRKGERVDHFETIRIAKDGRYVHISVTISPIRNREGNIVGASKIARDITAVREYERQLTDLVENATVGLHAVGPDGIILWANRHELEMLGYTLDEYVGQHISEFHTDQSVSSDILMRLGRAEKLHNYPAKLRCKDGSIRSVLISSCARFENGRFKNTQCFTNDVTERTLFEEERTRLLESERAARIEAERAGGIKDDFLATLSHELRTPLNAILGYAQLVRKGAFSAEELPGAMEVIERNARSQTQLVEDLLDLSRIVSGKIRIDVQGVNLASVIHAAIETLKPDAETKGVRLKTILDPFVRPVSGDPSRLQQVVWNLLSNAIKFTPRGGEVQVALERVDSGMEIIVSDTGEGIPPDYLPNVFDRFWQADPSITRRHGGLGIGLSIVKQLVELQGGTVRAKSPGVGRGSTFIVSLPVTVTDDHPRDGVQSGYSMPPSDRTSGDASENIDLTGVRVLVVDDDADARYLASRILASCHADVKTAASVSAALEEIRRQLPHVLLSDLGMPDRDGYDLIRAVRDFPPERGGEIPAIAFSAFARSEDRRRAMIAGYQTHLAKPVEPAELIAVVASLTGRIGRKLHQ